eukprot:scaffold10462_cov111-Skeletonema_marinoi.AAC.6
MLRYLGQIKDRPEANSWKRDQINDSENFPQTYFALLIRPASQKRPHRRPPRQPRQGRKATAECQPRERQKRAEKHCFNNHHKFASKERQKRRHNNSNKRIVLNRARKEGIIHSLRLC